MHTSGAPQTYQNFVVTAAMDDETHHEHGDGADSDDDTHDGSHLHAAATTTGALGAFCRLVWQLRRRGTGCGALAGLNRPCGRGGWFAARWLCG